MSSYAKIAAEAGDQYLAALSDGQDKFLKALSQFHTSMPSAPAFAAAFPTPQEINEASFAFTSKLLKQQKDFVEKLITISTPSTATPTKGSSAKN